MSLQNRLVLFVSIIALLDDGSSRPYNLHSTDHQTDGFCLKHYPSFEVQSSVRQTISYCLRDTDIISLLRNSLSNEELSGRWTWQQLKQSNVTAEQLLDWSASIEEAELYQYFLTDYYDRSSSSGNQSEAFINCTLPWFGPACRFRLELAKDISFDAVVEQHLLDRNQVDGPTPQTCYTHLKCVKPWTCLDWREICDQKMDCTDGSDEQYCWLLEIHQCAANEFRCHNGQCIPEEFFKDDQRNADCLDGSDEPERNFPFGYCPFDSAFRCEEYDCQGSSNSFPCGDGECTVPGTSECINGRDYLSINESCSRVVACLMKNHAMMTSRSCESYCKLMNCTKVKEEHCPSAFQYPPGPLLFGHVSFVFTNEPAVLQTKVALLPEFICFDERRCPQLSWNVTRVLNRTCVRSHSLNLRPAYSYLQNFVYLKTLFLVCSAVHPCHHSNMYQCQNSTKCISKYRLFDQVQDCPWNDDENSTSSKLLRATYEGIEPFSSQVSTLHEANTLDENDIRFSQICDGFPDLSPILIDGDDETDETNCKFWPCSNTYTRCDGFWTCDNGADEVNCSPSQCPNFEHSCVFFNDTTKISCLSMNRAGDGQVDCLGGTDEPHLCRRITAPYLTEKFFGCSNATTCALNFHLCDNVPQCPLQDDESFCHGYKKEKHDLCNKIVPKNEVQRFFCNFIIDMEPKLRYFRLENMPQYSNHKIIDRPAPSPSSKVMVKSSQSWRKPLEPIPMALRWRCHRGIRIRIRLNASMEKEACLCPPSYYGDQCQYQNDRISLTLRIRPTWNWRDVFLFAIILVDDDQHVHSHDLLEYLSFRDCDTKYNVYLQYIHRQKDPSRNYSIRIDSINQMSGNYRSSWIFPIHFPFLPVYRLSTILTVPHADASPLQPCSIPCFHGQCYRYVNAPQTVFCRCDSGWTGSNCDNKLECQCASNAYCLSHSLCMCPFERWGPRCHLLRTSCSPGYCANGGRCVYPDPNHTPASKKQPICICPEQYSGDRCQHQQSQLDISFHRAVSIPFNLVLHFIAVNPQSEPSQSSTSKRIPIERDSVSFYISYPFNIAIAQISTDFYLLVLRKQSIEAATITAQVHPSLQCRSIETVLTKDLANQHLLKRIKYYHRVCHQNPGLACFYDDQHMCLCELHEKVNCFRFHRNTTFDCHGSSVCENGGQCSLDRPICPTLGRCICQQCYYGSKCQFSTKGASLSLDTILGYQFVRGVRYQRQSLAVKLTVWLATIIMVLGLINSICSFLTFRKKNILKSGCGHYLFVSTISSMIILIILGIKCWFLYAWQTGSLTNKSLIAASCRYTDYLLRIMTTNQDWLYALIAIERTMTVVQGVNFDKMKCFKLARWITVLALLIISMTYLHEPMYREIIDDADDGRPWCIADYSRPLQVYDRAITVIHFSLPFVMNILSAIIIVICTSFQRQRVEKNPIFRKLCLREAWRYKHLLLSPCALVLMALPRLIISFLSGCMKSGRSPWLYLIGYFIRFLPSICIFIVFVLPSSVYKQQFQQTLIHLGRRTILQILSRRNRSS